jgi:ABC-type transport system substrate-binding protein
MRLGGLGPALALFAAAAVVEAALGPRYGGEVSVGVPELPTALAPAVPHSAAGRLLGGLVHETLIVLTADGLPAPSLAAAWTMGAGGREATLLLREGARFHDERPLEAADAVRSLRRFIREPGSAAQRLARSLEGGEAFRSGASEDLSGIAAGGRDRVVLRFTETLALPLAPLASPAAAVTGAGGAGCGPFVPTVWLPGRRLVLTAFGAHVRGRPYLDRVEVTAVANPSAPGAQAPPGRLDLALGRPGASTLAATLLLVLDPGRSPFREPAARELVARTMDGSALSRLVPGAESTASLLAPALLPPLGAEAPPRPGSLPGACTLAVATDVPPLASQRVVAHLQALGLGVRVLPSPPETAQAVPAEARLLLWSPEVPEAALALEELASLAPAAPPAARAALDEAAAEPDVDRRRALLHRAEGALRTEHVLVPLSAVPVAFGGGRGVHDFDVDLAGRLVLEDAWVEP